jgi:hypothetical protein
VTGGPGSRISFVLLLALGALVVASPAALADPTPAQAVAELNSWRAQVGEQPVSTADVAGFDTGCQHHNNYENLNGPALSHPETMGNPGYTSDGAVAGPDSVLAEEISEPAATPDSHMLPGPVWDGAVFHRAALLQPRLANTGFNSSTFDDGGAFYSWQCMWVQNMQSDPSTLTTPPAIDQTRTTPTLTLYPSPANGSYDVPTKFPGGESPDPASETGVPPGATLGWLMNVEINGPWTDSYFASARGVTASLEPDGTSNQVPVAVSQCGPSGCGGSGGTTLGLYFNGGFGIFPEQPLAANTLYHATATGTVTDFQQSKDYPFNISWCFSTGSSYKTSSDCHATTTGAGPEAATGLSPGGGGGGPLPPSQAGKPTLSHTKLSLGKKPKLAFTLVAGKNAPALKSLSISLLGGLSFSRKARATLGGHLKYSGGVSHGKLTVRLKGTSSKLGVTVSGGALVIGKSLASKLKHHKPYHLTITIKVVDAAGRTSTLRLISAAQP